MKDNRYKAIKSLIETESLKSLKEIFEILPVTVVRVDMKVNYNTLRRRIDTPKLLTVEDIVKLASLIEVDPLKIMRLVIADLKLTSGSKKK